MKGRTQGNACVLLMMLQLTVVAPLSRTASALNTFFNLHAISPEHRHSPTFKISLPSYAREKQLQHRRNLFPNRAVFIARMFW